MMPVGPQPMDHERRMALAEEIADRILAVHQERINPHNRRRI